MSYDQHAVIVNITSMTIPRFADRTCVLSPTDEDAYEFVKHESFVFYAEAREIEVAELEKLEAKRKRPVSPSLLSRMRAGLHQSRQTRRGFKIRVPVV
jgi:hypothetical protein